MKKIVSIILVAMMLLTPVMSLAAPSMNVRTKLSGFSLCESVSLCGEYSFTVPADLMLYQQGSDDVSALRLYVTEDASAQLLLGATMNNANTKAATQANTQIRSLASNSSLEPVAMPEALQETVGENGMLLRRDDDTDVLYYLLFTGEGEFSYELIVLAPVENEADALSWLCNLKKG